jgi:hypothetical protein
MSIRLGPCSTPSASVMLESRYENCFLGSLSMKKNRKGQNEKIHIQTWACWAYLLSRGPSEHVLEQVESQILISQEQGREDVSKKNMPLSYGSGFPGRKPHLSTPGLLVVAESHEGRTGREGDGGEGNLPPSRRNQ